MVNLPTKQTAIIFHTETNQLSFTDSAPVPSSITEHIIQVHSTAITNGELTWAPFVDWPTEHVPCYDVSGTVLTSVEGSKFKPGDRVFGRVDAQREGTARQYATILPSEAALIPSGLSLTDAASVPMSALTAWQALFEQWGGLAGAPFVDENGAVKNGDVAKGKRVLILGAAGGIGLFAVQFAKLAGATVFGTASGRNEAFLKDLGIDQFIDYTKQSPSAYVTQDASKTFDFVFDCVGGASMLDGWKTLKLNGTYVSVVPGFKEPEGGKPESVKSLFFIMKSRGSELAGIAKFFEKGLLKTWVDSIWPITNFEKAFAKTATGHARGKVVLKIGQDE